MVTTKKMTGAGLKKKGLPFEEAGVPMKELIVTPDWLLTDSGTYNYNIVTYTVKPPGGRGGLEPVEDPVYVWDKPHFEPDFPNMVYLNLRGVILRIDIDGKYPLNVVSGQVGISTYFFRPQVHFIGRVTSNVSTSEGTELVVEDLHVPNETNFTWPKSGNIIDRIEITIKAGFMEKTAEATFYSTESGTSYGPYACKKGSGYFHETEVEVDHEDEAQVVESYHTHTHPDRPADLPAEEMTVDSVYRDAGINAWVNEEGNVIDSSEAGDEKWGYDELHDAMEVHWSDFANLAQWKMWVFLAEHAESSSLAGTMFDAFIDEPGGVDRQGTAIFTRAEWIFSETGPYAEANPPEDASVERELFFTMVHEAGHCFNLFHPWSKLAAGYTTWDAPPWMPVVQDAQSLTWMNYPEQATPGGGYDAKWFYDRFHFRFTNEELLFLRHAPASYVVMGGEEFGTEHGRLKESQVDNRLQLKLYFPNKQVFELGEMIFAELRLKNVSKETLKISGTLDMPDGFVEIGITKPNGKKVALLPLVRNRTYTEPTELKPGESIYHSVNVSLSKAGFTFKEPGYYRLEAAYYDGRKGAADVQQIYVKPPAKYENMLTLSEIYDARTLRALYFGGTRVMDDVNQKLTNVIRKLGKNHPLSLYLRTVLSVPQGKPYKVFDLKANKIKLLPGKPDKSIKEMEVILDKGEVLADSIGNIHYQHLVTSYMDMARRAGKPEKAKAAQKRMLEIFRKKKMSANILKKIERQT